ncbi:MAG: hypothetical protein KBA99_11960, partial [Bacteroidia bacterium]|nr:hypothetical protein [Bacteroidia bacterium]
MKKVIWMLSITSVFFMAACNNEPKKADKEEKKEINITKEIKPGDAREKDENLKIVDDFYVAITARDSANLINCLHEDCKMYGTDPSEDWN